MLRFATLEERRKYYEEEFDPMKVREVLGDWNNFAIIIGKRTKIYKKEFEEIYHKTLKFECNFSELKDKILQFLPEAVYYVRRENEILLDFDPDRVHTKCQCKVK